MLSRTAEYAIRAVLALAGLDEGEAMPAAELAKELGVPRNYLSKTLNRLAKRGVLASVRGPGGGFRLGRSAESITLAEVVAEFDGATPSGQCVLGGRACDVADPCEAHDTWQRWSESVIRLMGDTTVADLRSGRTIGPPGEPVSGGGAVGGTGGTVDR